MTLWFCLKANDPNLVKAMNHTVDNSILDNTFKLCPPPSILKVYSVSKTKYVVILKLKLNRCLQDT
jgi:hypothetical protein